MGKATQTELSEKNPLRLPKARYYELKYYCLQYQSWKKRRMLLDGIATKERRDPTEEEAIERLELGNKIDMVDFAAVKACPELAEYIVYGVTTGKSYDVINARKQVPACREVYYAAYRKFFWILDRMRD